MSVAIETICVGHVYEFTGGPRRVAKLCNHTDRGFDVVWEYADGVSRRGRVGGRQWVHYFRRQAVRKIHDEWCKPVGFVDLQSGRTAPSFREPVTVQLHTKSPGKWAMVDQETGQIWTHDGNGFKHMSPEEIRELADLLERKVKTANEDQLQLSLP